MAQTITENWNRRSTYGYVAWSQTGFCRGLGYVKPVVSYVLTSLNQNLTKPWVSKNVLTSLNQNYTYWIPPQRLNPKTSVTRGLAMVLAWFWFSEVKTYFETLGFVKTWFDIWNRRFHINQTTAKTDLRLGNVTAEVESKDNFRKKFCKL